MESAITSNFNLIDTSGTLILKVKNPGISIKHKVNRILEQEEFKALKKKFFNRLTSREIEILTLLARGHNNPSISRELYISRCTVEQHRKNIHRKLGTTDLTGLYQFALAYDLI